jgi:hypothetical protein
MHNIVLNFRLVFPLLQWCVCSDLHYFLRMARKEKTEIILQNPSHLDNVVLARLKACGYEPWSICTCKWLYASANLAAKSAVSYMESWKTFQRQLRKFDR